VERTDPALQIFEISSPLISLSAFLREFAAATRFRGSASVTASASATEMSPSGLFIAFAPAPPAPVGKRHRGRCFRIRGRVVGTAAGAPQAAKVSCQQNCQKNEQHPFHFEILLNAVSIVQ
jgi:hypothetical protein